MLDAPQGYHQIRVATSSQDKLAFAGPDATKWTYNVMPFGPVNGPSTFIAFIHDLNGTRQDLARSLSLIINDDLNMTIIVDDIVSWSKTLIMALLYMECQLRICQSQNLSLSLKKLHIFVKQFEFVGVNVCIDGNLPAMSKHHLITCPGIGPRHRKICRIHPILCSVHSPLRSAHRALPGHPPERV